MKPHGICCLSVTMEHSYAEDHTIYTVPKGRRAQGSEAPGDNPSTFTPPCSATHSPSWDPKIRRVSLGLPGSSGEFIRSFIYPINKYSLKFSYVPSAMIILGIQWQDASSRSLLCVLASHPGQAHPLCQTPLNSHERGKGDGPWEQTASGANRLCVS